MYLHADQQTGGAIALCSRTHQNASTKCPHPGDQPGSALGAPAAPAVAVADAWMAARHALCAVAWHMGWLLRPLRLSAAATTLYSTSSSRSAIAGRL